jgi:antitoxin HicB
MPVPKAREFEVVLTPQPEGGFTVSVPELPDVITDGETREQALEMAKQAIEGYLDAMRDHGWEIPSTERGRVVVRAS